VGALHACAPGHGKSLAAGYLVGGRGRPRDAMWLGGVVAVMHTFSVAVLAVGWWLMAKRTPHVAALTGWLQLVAALVVMGVGVRLLYTHRRHRRQVDAHAQAHHQGGHSGGRDHGHGHGGGHEHGHGHGGGHEHGHSRHHIPDAPSLLTWRGIVLLGAAGGLLPSASAFLVLLAGLLTGKVAVALAMVTAFGVGMAVTLTGVGVLVLRSRDALLDRLLRSRALRTWTLRVPVFAASAVVVGGTVASALAAGQLLFP
jgi:ABC-type nickel/cobalt efflux system permease component RcnA